MPSNPKTKSTHVRIEQMQGKQALLESWEQQPEDVQVREHDYILHLKKMIRQIRNYILHRADKDATV